LVGAFLEVEDFADLCVLFFFDACFEDLCVEVDFFGAALSGAADVAAPAASAAGAGPGPGAGEVCALALIGTELAARKTSKAPADISAFMSKLLTIRFRLHWATLPKSTQRLH
jgi:hypothetical protein